MKEYIIQVYAKETIDEFDRRNAPELVRCKDCKHRLECDYWIENGDEWFCADGERR